MGTRREQILDAATQVTAESGVHGLTHRKVDAHGGLPFGTTANYFRTRQALTVAVIDHALERVGMVTEPDLNDQADAEQRLLTWLRHHLHVVFGGTNDLSVRAFNRIASEANADTGPTVFAKIVEKGTDELQRCRAIVCRCGSTDPDKHAEMLHMLIGAIFISRHAFPLTDDDPDHVLAPPVHGLISIIERDAREATDGTT